MKTTFDLNAILFRLLNGNTSITGGVYVDDDLPEGSKTEDIVVNTIDLGIDAMPQTGTSNINVYVPDANFRIRGAMQLQANRARLKELTDEVLDIIRNAVVDGLKLIPMNVHTFEEINTKQHFVNIRVDWNIQS